MQIVVTSDHQAYDTPAQRANLAALLSDIQAIGAAATFHCGDLVHLGDMAEVAEEPLDGVTFADYMNALYASGHNPQSFYPIAGNHDMECHLSASPNTRWAGSGFYSRFRRPPVYALTCGNMAFVFCGYEAFHSVEQINSGIVLDALEDLLKQFHDSHNVFLFTHAPLYEAGLFDASPASEWMRLKPQGRWASIFDTYRIDAHFCGHSATDIISADEVTVKTATTRTAANGHTTSHILTGPHMEQRHWNASHRLGGRVLSLQGGATSVTVRMRDHDAGDWIEAKEITVPVRFPVLLSDAIEDHSTKLQGQLMRGPLRVLSGVGDSNSTGTAAAQARRIAAVFEWADPTQSDIQAGAEHLIRIVAPSDDLGGPSVMFGVRKANPADADEQGGFVIYGSDGAGNPTQLAAQAGAQFRFSGDNYPTSQLFPMWEAKFSGSIPATAPLRLTYTAETYDDFTMLDAATGVLTCKQPGVYEVRGQVQINGNVNAFADNVTLQFRRIRAGVAAVFGSSSHTLMGGTNSMQTLTAADKIGLLVGDTLELELTGWATNNANTLTRAGFSGHMIRGV